MTIICRWPTRTLSLNSRRRLIMARRTTRANSNLSSLLGSSPPASGPAAVIKKPAVGRTAKQQLLAADVGAVIMHRNGNLSKVLERCPPDVPYGYEVSFTRATETHPAEVELDDKLKRVSFDATTLAFTLTVPGDSAWLTTAMRETLQNNVYLSQAAKLDVVKHHKALQKRSEDQSDSE